MSLYKNIFSILLILLLLETQSVFPGNNNDLISPAHENTTEEDTYSKLTFKDISGNNEKNIFFPIYSLIDSIKQFFLITFFLPISYFFIRLFTNSSRTPRLPPINQH